MDRKKTYDRLLGSAPLGPTNFRDYAGRFLINSLTEKHVVAKEKFRLCHRTGTSPA